MIIPPFVKSSSLSSLIPAWSPSPLCSSAIDNVLSDGQPKLKLENFHRLCYLPESFDSLLEADVTFLFCTFSSLRSSVTILSTTLVVQHENRPISKTKSSKIFNLMIAQLADVGKTSSILELVRVILEYFWAGKGLFQVNKSRFFRF